MATETVRLIVLDDKLFSSSWTLNTKHKQALVINFLVTSLVTYSLNVMKWYISDVRKIDAKIRKLLKFSKNQKLVVFIYPEEWAVGGW